MRLLRVSCFRQTGKSKQQIHCSILVKLVEHEAGGSHTVPKALIQSCKLNRKFSGFWQSLDMKLSRRSNELLYHASERWAVSLCKWQHRL